MDPSTVKPTEGKVLVEITEVLGGQRGHLWLPPKDDAWKDTAMGRVVSIGPRPAAWHRQLGSGYDLLPGREPWPAGYPPIEVGQVVVFPRDVPKAWAWEGRRYALILLGEILMLATEEESIEVCAREA
jgi:hypothetical protein